MFDPHFVRELALSVDERVPLELRLAVNILDNLINFLEDNEHLLNPDSVGWDLYRITGSVEQGFDLFRRLCWVQARQRCHSLEWLTGIEAPPLEMPTDDALAPYYRGRGVWMANGKTIAVLRKIKDTTGQYLWQPAVTADQPATFLDCPIVEAVDLPDIAAGVLPILFGDFASAYRIYDRISLSLLRDPYSQATSGLTRFYARRRVGARVVRAEAVRSLKIAAS